MEIICLFAQRKCRYDGEYAPELLAAIDEYGDDDNHGYIDEAKEKADKDNSFSFSKVITITVPNKEFNNIFFGNSTIEGSIKIDNCQKE